MKFKGVNYDTGTKTITGSFTRETLDLNTITKEIEIIKNELHCYAIRISGLNIERMVQASEVALKTGLTVWFFLSLLLINVNQMAAATPQLTWKMIKRPSFPILFFFRQPILHSLRFQKGVIRLIMLCILARVKKIRHFSFEKLFAFN